MTLRGQRCSAVDANGAQCALVAGHPGDHALGPPPAPAVAPPAPPQLATSAAPAAKKEPFLNLKLIVVGLVVVALALGAYSLLAKPWQPLTTTPATPRQAVNVEGSGIMNSEPFSLSGDYAVQWTAKAATDVGCYHGTSLESSDGRRAAELISKEVSGNESGTVYVYQLDPGRYYVRASSGCDWSFTFTPQ